MYVVPHFVAHRRHQVRMHPLHLLTYSHQVLTWSVYLRCMILAKLRYVAALLAQLMHRRQQALWAPQRTHMTLYSLMHPRQGLAKLQTCVANVAVHHSYCVTVTNQTLSSHYRYLDNNHNFYNNHNNYEQLKRYTYCDNHVNDCFCILDTLYADTCPYFKKASGLSAPASQTLSQLGATT